MRNDIVWNQTNNPTIQPQSNKVLTGGARSTFPQQRILAFWTCGVIQILRGLVAIRFLFKF